MRQEYFNDNFMYGPRLKISEEIHATKYRLDGETFYDCCNRQAATLGDDDTHRRTYKEILLDQRFMPAGRVQAAIGSPRVVTPWNCFVSQTITDSFTGIMKTARDAGETMRLGGGIGYDFSTLRPKGSLIKSLGSSSSGPVSFMDIFDAICGTISSAGHRRGAQMGVLRVDHPDILEFIHAKRNENRLTRFNISVGITDEFMHAVKDGNTFSLKWRGKVYSKVDARNLWDEIMRSTWDWAEPGVLFIDRINEMNNLWYCETISATNPCGEQPLPPYGACLLGSFNLVKYIGTDGEFMYDKLREDIPHVVMAMDNIIDVGVYPLSNQEEEGKNKRRMGLGVTGLANAIERIGAPYGTKEFVKCAGLILKIIRDESYRASALLAKEKGAFPLYDERYLKGKFVQQLPNDIKDIIRRNGIRNSHLTSIAPTGTISLSADNISSGIEPVFTHSYERTIQTEEGQIIESVTDFAFREWGQEGRTANTISVDEHLDVLIECQKYVDSACSKTCNVGEGVGWDDFKGIYMRAWEEGAKGCTTFRASGKRYGILNETKKDEPEEKKVDACFINQETGQPECS